MKKFLKTTIIVYATVILGCVLYCNPSKEVVISMFVVTTIITGFNYLVVLLEKINIKTGINSLLTELTGGLSKYVVYIFTFGFIITACLFTVNLIKTKNFIFACMYLPIIGSLHANSLILKMYT